MENEKLNEMMPPQRQDFRREYSIEVIKGTKISRFLGKKLTILFLEKAAVDFDAKLGDESQSSSDIEDGLILESMDEAEAVQPKELQREISIEVLKGKLKYNPCFEQFEKNLPYKLICRESSP